MSGYYQQTDDYFKIKHFYSFGPTGNKGYDKISFTIGQELNFKHDNKTNSTSFNADENYTLAQVFLDSPLIFKYSTSIVVDRYEFKFSFILPTNFTFNDPKFAEIIPNDLRESKVTFSILL